MDCKERRLHALLPQGSHHFSRIESELWSSQQNSERDSFRDESDSEVKRQDPRTNLIVLRPERGASSLWQSTNQSTRAYHFSHRTQPFESQKRRESSLSALEERYGSAV